MMRLDFRQFTLLLVFSLQFGAGCGRGSPVPGDVKKTVEYQDPEPLERLADAIKGHRRLSAALTSLDAQVVLGDSNAIVTIGRLKDISDKDVKVLQEYAGSELTSLRELELSGRHVTDAALVHLRDFEQLERLNVSGTAVTGKGLAALAELPKLRILNLSLGVEWYDGLGPIPGTGPPVDIKWRPEPKYKPAYPYGPRGGKYYKEIPEVPIVIESAKLGRLAVTDSDLAPISKLTRLEELSLAKTLVTDSGLIHLEQHAHLQILDLSGTLVTGRGLAFLPSQLLELNLKDAKVTSEALLHSKDWPFTKLQILDFSGNSLTGDGFDELSNLPELKTLRLDRNPLSDVVVLQLGTLAKLEHLTLRDTKITAAGIERLRRALPRCDIEWGASPSESNSE